MNENNVLRKDGDPEAAFRTAANVLERTHTAPHLAHNAMETVNCFANVTADKADIYGPIQAPEFISHTLSARLGMPKDYQATGKRFYDQPFASQIETSPARM